MTSKTFRNFFDIQFRTKLDDQNWSNWILGVDVGIKTQFKHLDSLPDAMNVFKMFVSQVHNREPFETRVVFVQQTREIQVQNE